MNKVLMFLVPLLVIGGIAGAGMAGIVDIPGLTPKKAKPKPKTEADKTGEDATPVEESAPAASEPPPPQEQAPAPAPSPSASKAAEAPVDPVQGQKKIAALWSEIETPQLLKIVADWKDPELAAILRRMDPAKTAEILASMDGKRASALSREIQKQSAAGA